MSDTTATGDIGYDEKAIDVIVTLGLGGTFTLTGLRVVATITTYAPPHLGQCDVKVYGVAKDTLAAISNLNNLFYQTLGNTVTILAGTVDNTSVVFQGLIWDAFLNFDQAPETCLEITAHSLVRQWKQLGNFAATSVEGPTTPDAVIQDIMNRAGMTDAGWTFDNEGVTVPIHSSVFQGSPWTQIGLVAKQGNFNWHHDDQDLVVYIWPKGQTLGFPVPTISPATGMIGYPQKVQQNRVRIKCLFNNNIIIMQNITVAGSEVPQANGLWQVMSLVHELSAQVPGGPWFSSMTCWTANAGVGTFTIPDDGEGG